MKKTKFFTPALWVTVAVTALSAAVYMAARLFTPFAEWWAKYPSQWVRAFLAAVTNIIPFSVAEMILLLLLPAVIIYILATNRFIRGDDKENYYRCLRPLLMIVLLLASSFLGVFGPCYFRKGLDENLGLTKAPVTAGELAYTAERLIEEIEKLDVNIYKDGSTFTDKSYGETIDDVKTAFKKYCGENKYISYFNSNPKLISLSPVMTYTHISGLYSFFTGEANINFNYPDFVFPFTVAHEMAHQRGIAREDEANFVAFLVCAGSDDSYVRYSGYMNVLEYVLSALSKADAERYKSLVKNTLTDEIKGELRAFNTFFEKYTDSPASTVVGAINDSYLSSQGQTAGSASYGLVVDLAVAYYKQK